MLRNYDIKFVNKEITPFGGLSWLSGRLVWAMRKSLKV